MAFTARKNVHRLAVGFGLRTAVACAVLHAAKAGLKRLTKPPALAGRRRRLLGRCVAFVCDVALPTAVFGPLLAGVAVADKLLRERELPVQPA